MNRPRSRVQPILISMLVVFVSGFAAADPSIQDRPETLWVIPHTHWEGAVFKTREEYLEMGFPHILHALQLLRQYPRYTFVLDQVAYIRPFLERYPEQEALFRKFVSEGRLELVLGMDVMPDDSKPGAETFIRQIQYGKGYLRQKLGVDVTCAWLLDTFGHHAQLPQILKLGGYKSFWFARGVPNADQPSEFLWQGIDGTRIPSFWLPQSYGLFWGAPSNLADFEKFARQRFAALNRNSHGPDRVALAGVDVSDPEDQLPAMMEAASHDDKLPFKLRFGVPREFEAAVARRTDLPVFKGDLNPIFQGTYSSRVELKQWMRRMERLLTDAEKLGVLAEWLGAAPDNQTLWKAWEPVLFNETHDLASGVMTDHVYEDTVRQFEFSQRLASQLIDQRFEQVDRNIDTQGTGAAIIVFSTLGWDRSDIANVTVGFVDAGIKGIMLTDDKGVELSVQLLDTVRGRDGGIRQGTIAFVAQDVPAMGYRVFHAVPRFSDGAPQSAVVRQDPVLENQFYRISFDALTGAMTGLHVKEDDWEAIRGPANVIARQDDHGDLWELYQGLDGGSRFAMTRKQPVPQLGNAVLSDHFKGQTGIVRIGPVFDEFVCSHPFDNGSFSTTVRLAHDSRRIDITTTLVNNSKFVRYQALFPTTIHDGISFQSIPFGAIRRPQGIEFPAQEWVDWGDENHGVAILNIGLPGNLVSDGTLMLSLLRAHTLGAYGFGGGYEPGMSSDTGFELGKERTLHYAMLPHRGDWRDAQVYREAMEFAHPLICRKSAAHSGPMPPRRGFLSLSQPNVVVSALTSGYDGAAILRVYEAAGRAARDVKLTLPAKILSASDTNLMEDPGPQLKALGDTLHFDLSPFQIRNFSLRLERPK